MDEIGKTYYYKYKGIIKKGKLVNETKAWFIFDNGDLIRSYSPLYDTREELENISNLVEEMYKNTYVPNVVHIPNYSTR